MRALRFANDLNRSLRVINCQPAILQHLRAEKSFGYLWTRGNCHFDLLAEPIDFGGIGWCDKDVSGYGVELFEAFKVERKVPSLAIRNDQTSSESRIDQYLDGRRD